jgi:hypothetical protein
MSVLSAKVYRRVARAFRNKKGIRLTADELYSLVVHDDAIEMVVLDLIAEMENQ